MNWRLLVVGIQTALFSSTARAQSRHTGFPHVGKDVDWRENFVFLSLKEEAICCSTLQYHQAVLCLLWVNSEGWWKTGGQKNLG